MTQVFAGLFTEGSTDVRFLQSIIKKTIDDIAFQCKKDVETELILIDIDKTGLGFVDQVIKASNYGMLNYSIHILFVHCDSDNKTDSHVFDSKINPAIAALTSLSDDNYCKMIVPVVPIQETESWMLADKDLLRKQIGTTMNDLELKINRLPEQIAQPKEVIEEAIRIASETSTRRQRRRGITISDLYLIVGQELELNSLQNFVSYKKFVSSSENAFRNLNLL